MRFLNTFVVYKPMFYSLSTFNVHFYVYINIEEKMRITQLVHLQELRLFKEGRCSKVFG
jgi:hypothetical protein